MIASLVRFRSRLSDDEVRAAFVERAQRYFDVPGLVEKIYLRFRNSGEFGALYVWESESALEEFERNALARTIGDVYRVEEVPISELADVCLLIRPKPAASHEAGTSIRAEGS